MGAPTAGRWGNSAQPPVNYSKPFPLVPFAAYYDIFRTWYCDPQSDFFYVGSVLDDGCGITWGFQQQNLSLLGVAFRRSIIAQLPLYPPVWILIPRYPVLLRTLRV